MTTRRQFLQLSVTGAVAAAAAAIPFASAANAVRTATGGSAATGSNGNGRIAITQVRNATLIVHYAGVKFLIDPYLAEKGAYWRSPASTLRATG